MKSRYVVSLCVIVLVGFFASQLRAEEFSSLVNSEVQKEQTELQHALSKSRRAIVELENSRKRVIDENQALAKLQIVGLDQLRKYIVLLQTRYVNDNGEYQPSMVITPNDVEHINKLLDGYLRANPLTGKVSAGHAERLLLWGILRLDEISKMNANPTDKNNPELEIISKKMLEAEAKNKTTELLAQRLGVVLSKTDDFSEVTSDNAAAPVESKTDPKADPKKPEAARRLPALAPPKKP